MGYYNLTTIIGSPDIGTLATSMNAILNGYYYGYFILLTVFIVVFFYLRTKGYLIRSCAAAACWMTTLLALFLRPMNLIDNYIFWICVLLTVLATFILSLMDEM